MKTNAIIVGVLSARTAWGVGSPRAKRVASASCTRALDLVPLSDAPTPGPLLESYLSAHVTADRSDLLPADACDFIAVTDTEPLLQAEKTSLATAISSWFDAHVCDFQAVARACSDVPEVASVLLDPAALCTDFRAQLETARCDGSSSTSSSNRETAAPTTTPSPPGATGEDGGETAGPDGSGDEKPNAAATRGVAGVTAVAAMLIGVLSFVAGL